MKRSSRRPSKWATSPRFLSLVSCLGLPAFITAAWSMGMNLPPLPVWLVAVNLMALAVLGKDKFAAGKPGWARTPEFTLLTLTFVGATPAILIGRKLFNHKTTKEGFTSALWGAITAQAIAIFLLRDTLIQWF